MDKVAEMAIKAKMSSASEQLGLNKISKGMDKLFDKVDGSKAAKTEEKEASIGSKIMDKLKTDDMKAADALKERKAEREKLKEEMKAEYTSKLKENEDKPAAEKEQPSGSAMGAFFGKMKAGVSSGTGALNSLTRDLKKSVMGGGKDKEKEGTEKEKEETSEEKQEAAAAGAASRDASGETKEGAGGAGDFSASAEGQDHPEGGGGMADKFKRSMHISKDALTGVVGQVNTFGHKVTGGEALKSMQAGFGKLQGSVQAGAGKMSGGLKDLLKKDDTEFMVDM